MQTIPSLKYPPDIVDKLDAIPPNATVPASPDNGKFTYLVGATCQEAASEIKRLRAKVAEMEGSTKARATPVVPADKEIDQLWLAAKMEAIEGGSALKVPTLSPRIFAKKLLASALPATAPKRTLTVIGWMSPDGRFSQQQGWANCDIPVTDTQPYPGVEPSLWFIAEAGANGLSLVDAIGSMFISTKFEADVGKLAPHQERGNVIWPLYRLAEMPGVQEAWHLEVFLRDEVLREEFSRTPTDETPLLDLPRQGYGYRITRLEAVDVKMVRSTAPDL